MWELLATSDRLPVRICGTSAGPGPEAGSRCGEAATCGSLEAKTHVEDTQWLETHRSAGDSSAAWAEAPRGNRSIVRHFVSQLSSTAMNEMG